MLQLHSLYRALEEPLRPSEETGIDFARLVGAKGWHALPQAVRERFSHRYPRGKATRYTGTMQIVACSWLGYLLAQAGRLFGTPFAPFEGVNIPVTIELKPEEGGGHGVVWERIYSYPGRAPIRVCSTKRLAADGVLTECVGDGIGMRLAVYEEDHALHFRSERYFERIGPFEIPLPRFATPGIAHVIHSDLCDGWFHFEMTFQHPWFGTLFRQDGIFRAEGDVS
jgi:hypothetical protein